jgi:two-component system nitrogen regulation sensor histidine kinase NtrY
VRLRTRLALAFALFAAVPLAAALWPVSHALSGALSTEHAARLDGAARALDGELARLAREAETAVDELASSADAEALARELGTGALAPADAAARAREWMDARGLDVLAVAEPDGRVVSSGHLPGRAGDLDAEVAALLATPPLRAAPHRVMRAGPDGVEPVLALVAWAPLPGDPLRVAGGLALGPERAARLAELTGGAIAIRAPDGALLADAAAPGSPSGGAPDLADRLSARLGALGTPVRSLALGPPDAPVATVEVRLASAGLARARLVVIATFLAALVTGVLAAAAVGALLASRVTRPVEALRAAALRVAAGDLGARVEARAAGEVAELVRAFNMMTADLAASRTRLAQAERVAAWREVARRLAHEIKNPLTPIAMSVETLRDAHARARPDFGEIFDEGTRAIGEEVRRLKRIVDEFSRFARLPAPDRTPVAPDELVQSVLALFPSAPAGVVVAREVEAGLPAVLADRDQVLQVLLNLVRNALEAMPAGGTLRIAARGEGGAVAFSVSDTGPGVRPEDQPRVFEPYFTTKEGGTGLGLAIAQRIAEEHGGTLELRSAPGEGATFTLTLPAVG